MRGKAFLSKTLKSIHIILASGIIGGLAAILVLLSLKVVVDAAAYSTLDRGILAVFRWMITYPSFAFIVTSCLYSLFFGWGILRFGWVALKWLLLIGLFALVWFGLGPAVSGLSSVSDAGFHLSSMAERYASYSNQAAVTASIGLVFMATAILFSTLRPFGQRRDKESPAERIISAIVLAVVIVGVTGLMVSEQNLEKYRRMPIKEINAARIPDGVYPGESMIGNFVYRVEVEVKSGTIVEISAVDSRNSVYVEYARGVFSKIIQAQTANTDAITGATTTSKAYMKAVEDALSKAGGQ
ncbi:MAG: FMN-binding protein [Spirochaetaceae bacterium]|nr:MAG: FMN-binding protein [Spirochaetaceae bacterium]